MAFGWKMIEITNADLINKWVAWYKKIQYNVDITYPIPGFGEGAYGIYFYIEDKVYAIDVTDFSLGCLNIDFMGDYRKLAIIINNWADIKNEGSALLIETGYDVETMQLVG